MANETDFLNDSLGQIGATRVTGIDDGSVNANWCKVFYPELRRAMLRSHHWNFAEARLALPQDASAPAFEFAYAYNLPAALLKIKNYNGNAPVVNTAVDPNYWTTIAGYYKIEGRQLLTNDGQALVVYVKDITNPDVWDPLFYQMLSAMLAAKLATAIPHDANKAAMLMKTAVGFWFDLATAVDGQEGSIIPYMVDDLLWGR